MGSEQEQHLITFERLHFGQFLLNVLGERTDETIVDWPSINNGQTIRGQRPFGTVVLGHHVEAAARCVATVLGVLRQSNHIGHTVSV